MKTLLPTVSFLISFTVLSSQSWALPLCPKTGYFDNCFGSIILIRGNKSVGEWKNNKRHGKGVFTWFKPFEQYEGEFKNGLPHGKGSYTYSSGNKYIGEFQNNKRHGQGTFKWMSGDKYTGQWKDNNKHGVGIYNYVSGNKYDGEWKNDQKNGQGTFLYANGKIKKGIWKDGEFMDVQKPTFTSNPKIEEYKSICSEIGFTPGTEKFGECVVEAMKKG